jgi:hypothetical protein
VDPAHPGAGAVRTAAYVSPQVSLRRTRLANFQAPVLLRRNPAHQRLTQSAADRFAQITIIAVVWLDVKRSFPVQSAEVTLDNLLPLR